MTLFFLSPPTPIPKRNGKNKKQKKERNSYYYYYNTIFFLKKLLHPKEGSETMLPARVTTTCAHEVSSGRPSRQAHLFPTASAPHTFQREETLHLQPSRCPSWGGDIPTSSHSFSLLWKIKVKNLHQPATAASPKDLLLLPPEKREEKAQLRCSLNFPQFMNNFNFFCCFVLTKGMRLT